MIGRQSQTVEKAGVRPKATRVITDLATSKGDRRALPETASRAMIAVNALVGAWLGVTAHKELKEGLENE